MKILAYTSPARGHLNPMMPPLLELARAGDEVQVRTILASVEGVRAAGLAAEPIDPRIEAIELDDHERSSQLEGGKRAYAIWASRAPLEVGDLRAAIGDVAPDLLLIDTTTYGARAVAEASGLPWAESRPLLLEDRAPGIPPYGLGLKPRRDRLGRIRDAVLYRVTDRFDRQSRLPAVNAGRRAAGLEELPTMDEARHRAPLTLLYTAEPFDYPRPPIEGVIPVGPCAWEPPAELDIELDGRPLVLVTLSSEYQDDSEIARAALAGLTADHQVVVTSAGVDPESLPAPGGAVVRRFLPHSALLEHASAVVCHGGMGVTQKTLSHGVPLVVVPWGRDQLDVAVHVTEAGAGMVVPRKKLSPERLAAAVAEAQTKRDGAERVAEGYRRSGNAARAAEALASLGGESSQRPAAA